MTTDPYITSFSGPRPPKPPQSSPLHLLPILYIQRHRNLNEYPCIRRLRRSRTHSAKAIQCPCEIAYFHLSLLYPHSPSQTRERILIIPALPLFSLYPFSRNTPFPHSFPLTPSTSFPTLPLFPSPNPTFYPLILSLNNPQFREMMTADSLFLHVHP